MQHLTPLPACRPYRKRHERRLLRTLRRRPGIAHMPRMQQSPRQDRIARRGQATRLDRELEWLPERHPIVCHAAQRQQGRIRRAAQIVVRRVSRHVGVIFRHARIAPERERRRAQRMVLVMLDRGQHIQEWHLRNHASPQVGPHRVDRAHQEATRRESVRHDAPLAGVTLGNQVFGAGDEVGEGCLLALLEHRTPPLGATLGAAAHVGDGVDPALFHQRDRRRRKLGIDRRAV